MGETAQSRNEPLFPALIYSSTVAYMAVMATDQPSSTTQPRESRASGNGTSPASDEAGFTTDWSQEAQERVEARRARVQVTAEDIDEDEDERGIKLGLGDFIFYSVLVGKASSYGDWNTTIACFVAILIG